LKRRQRGIWRLSSIGLQRWQLSAIAEDFSDGVDIISKHEACALGLVCWSFDYRRKQNKTTIPLSMSSVGFQKNLFWFYNEKLPELTNNTSVLLAILLVVLNKQRHCELHQQLRFKITNPHFKQLENRRSSNNHTTRGTISGIA
jgi:hypothetical protein